MSTFQKIVKYLALAFALFLVVSIFSGVFTAIYCIGSAFTEGEETSHEVRTVNEREWKDANALLIDLRVAGLEVKEGETLMAETDNPYVSIRQEDNVIEISEEKHNLIRSENKGKVTLYIPKNMKFNKVSIQSGAGEIKMDSLTVDDLELKLGAGEFDASYLEVKEEATVTGGVGEIRIRDGAISNLDIDMGVGEARIDTALLGTCQFDLGIGELRLKVQGNRSDYTVKVNKGIGAYIIDDKNVNDNGTIGDGENHLELNGGIGEVRVSFE